MVVKIERVRYLKVDFLGNAPDISKFVSTLRRTVRTVGGEIKLATSGLHVIEYTEHNAIIRCTHDHRDLVEAAVQLLAFPRLWIVVRKVSGTLKALSKTATDNINEDEEIDSEN